MRNYMQYKRLNCDILRVRNDCTKLSALDFIRRKSKESEPILFLQVTLGFGNAFAVKSSLQAKESVKDKTDTVITVSVPERFK